MKLDELDKRILAHLQQDAKITNKELSLSLDLSVTAIYERIKKMERSGVISKYVTLLNKNSLGLGFQVFCHVKLQHHGNEVISSFEDAVSALDEVLECFHVSGDYDYLLKVVVKDMDHFRDFVVKKLITLDHIGSTQSSFTINEVKSTNAIAL